MPDATSMPNDRAGPDWIRLDRLIEDLGEDPGRFLDGSLDPIPRIRGLETVAEVRAWIGAERRIANIRNRRPREAVMAALQQRETFLEDYVPEPRDLDASPEKRVLYHTGDGEVVPYDEVDRSGALERIGTAIATDGGEQSDG